MFLPKQRRSIAHFSRGSQKGRYDILKAVTAALALSLIIGCRDEAVLSPASTPSARNAVEVAPDSPNWNRFEAEITVLNEGPALATPGAKHVRLAATYRLMKRREAAGPWVTEHWFNDLVPRGTGRPYTGPPRLARVVTAPGSEPLFYDVLGRLMKPPGIPSLPTSSPNPDFPRSQQPTVSVLPRAARGSMSGADTSRGWADRYIVTAVSAERVRAGLVRAAGSSARGLAGHTRFVLKHGDAQSEIDLNDETGTIDIVRVTSRGRAVQEVRREYTGRGDGVWVLKSERIVRFNPNGGGATKSTLVTYRNVRVMEEH